MVKIPTNPIQPTEPEINPKPPKPGDDRPEINPEPPRRDIGKPGTPDIGRPGKPGDDEPHPDNELPETPEPEPK